MPETPRPSGEFTLIDKIKKELPHPGTRTLLGIGDDAAILAPGKEPLLICTDAMAEGVHFDLEYCTSEDIGHKALASCLSDIAAMNGKPLAALFSLALPASIAPDFLDGFYKGVSALARLHSVDVIGGDLSASRGGIFIDVTCVGESVSPIRRSGARPGDRIAVSGSPGRSAAGLAALRRPELRNPALESLVQAHLRPKPRFDLLASFNQAPGLCTALIDISDGLASELGHIARASQVDIVVDTVAIPIDRDAKTLGAALALDPLQWVLGGGEDYELLAAFAPDELAKLGGPPEGFTLIGHVVSRRSPGTSKVFLAAPDGSHSEISAVGYVHF